MLMLMRDDETEPMGELTETLPVTTGELLRRVTAMASARGLLVVPMHYTPKVIGLGTRNCEHIVDTAQDQGPLVVVAIEMPPDRLIDEVSAVEYSRSRLDIITSGRRLVSGRPQYSDIAFIPRDQRGQYQWLTSPVVIDRGSQMQLTTELPASSAVWQSGDAVRIVALAFRERVGGVLSVPGSVADDLVFELRRQGELYLAAVETAPTPGDFYVALAEGDVVVETIIVATDPIASNNNLPSSIDIKLADLSLAPGDAWRPALIGATTSRIASAMTGLRIPLVRSTRARIITRYRSDATAPTTCRYTLIGRRAPAADC